MSLAVTKVYPVFPSPDPRILCLLETTEAHPGLAAGIPPPGLLSPAELARWEGFAVPKRRRDWLLGRWTAKHLVQAYLALRRETMTPFEEIEILPGEDGAPIARFPQPLSLSLSISHSGTESFCAVCPGEAGQVGADIEQVEARDPAFAHTFFTVDEIAAVEKVRLAERDPLVTALWSVKEAVLKTLRLGLRADTRQVHVHIPRLTAEWSSVTTRIAPALLDSPSDVVDAWCLAQPDRVLSLALLTHA